MGAPAGGFADKIGNRYEAVYLVQAALDLLNGERLSIQWEGMGQHFQGIEYRSRLQDGTVEAVQCKSNRERHWTLAALNSEGVLSAIREQLAVHGTSRFTLILAGHAPDLHALAQRAAASTTVDAFGQCLSADHQRAFAKLLQAWNLADTPGDRDLARQWLARVRTLEHSTPESIERYVEKRCGDLFVNPPAAVRAAIREVLEEYLGQELTADLLVRQLRSDRYGFQLRDWSLLPDQVEAVEALRQRFHAQLGRLLIRGRLIPRSESEVVLKALTDPLGSKVVLLHGGAGVGKSGVLYEVVDRLRPTTCVIPVRLDNSLPSGGGLLRYSREVLQLPDTPDRCAARLSGGRRAVIVVDQLDAVRWAGVHSTAAWDVTLELLDAAIRMSNVSVVIACRTFDMKDDPHLRNWRKEQAGLGRILEIEVKTLEPAIVEQVLAAPDGVRPNARQLALVRNPLMLSLWCDLADRGVDLAGVNASSSLLSEHWSNVKRRIAERRGITNQAAEEVMSEVRAWAETRGRLDFPETLVSNRAVLDALASESYLDRIGTSRFRVSHQRYLDHQVALAVFREVAKIGTTVAHWLRRTDQSLMRREQVRQVLALLRDGDPALYAKALEELLSEAGIREHIRDLVLRILAEVAQPLPAESALVMRRADDPSWAPRIRHRTLTTPVWWLLLLHQGTLERWLSDESGADWRWAAWACRHLAESEPQRVSELLELLVKNRRLDHSRMLFCLPHSTKHDTAATARWRFAAHRQGELRCELHEVAFVAKDSPESALRLAAHILRWELAHLRHPGLMPKGPPGKFERWSAQRGNDFAQLRSLGGTLPRATWSTIAPLVLRSLRWLTRTNAQRAERGRWPEWNHPVRGLNTIMRSMLVAAAAPLGEQDPTWLWEQLRPFLHFRSRTATRLVTEVLGVLGGPLPCEAVNWFLSDLRRFGVCGRSDNLARYWHGRRVVRHLWDVAPEHRSSLVAALRHFHDPGEMELLGYRQEYVRQGHADYIRNLIGLPQYLLLSALPVRQIDDDTRHRVAQWDSKYCVDQHSLRAPRPEAWFLSRPRDWSPERRVMRFRSARDLIPVDRISRVPDGQWIEMASPDWSKRIAQRWKLKDRLSFETPDRMAEAAFSRASKSNPARFIKLAQRLPLDAADHWFEVVLDAASAIEPDQNLAAPDWEAASPADVEACLARLSRRDGKHLSKTLARLERARPTELWSDATINHVCELALSHEDPEPGEFQGPEGMSADDLVQMSINCTRGAAVESIERLMWHRLDRRDQFIRVSERAVRDPHPAVRVAAIGLAGPLLNDDPDLAIRLLEEACSHEDVRVLRSYHLRQLLRFLWWRADPRVEGIVTRMASSGIESIECDGALFATVVSLRIGRMTEVASQCARGTPAQRRGAATALAQLTECTTEGRSAALMLPPFFDDEDTSVAGAAASVFRDESLLRSPLGPELALRFVASEQFARDPDDLIFPLSEFAGDLLPFQAVIEAVVGRATSDMSDLRGDMRRAGYGFADRTSECILRIYERAQAGEHAAVRKWCLDQIDALVADGNSFGEQALARLDVDA